jgi:hypothetical protein
MEIRMAKFKNIMFRLTIEEEFRDSFYEMKQISEDKWQARWGRYGSEGITKEESMSIWKDKIKYILGKGYKEIGNETIGMENEDLSGPEYELN